MAPPRTAVLDRQAPLATWSRARIAEGLPPLELPRIAALGDPATPYEKRRNCFRPKRGWLRRLERRLSHRLARDLYPHIPGLTWFYSRQMQRRLSLSEAVIELPGLAPEFSGCRVLFVSDIHVGPFVSPRAMRNVMRRLAALEPDLILLGGDIVTSSVREFESQRTAFSELRAPLGVFAVLGNHDHYSEEPQRMRQSLEQAGIQTLHNRGVVLRRGAGRLDLAGVDDMLLGQPDLDAALEHAARPVILLSHNPDLFFEAARRGVELMLSGHTHAGQLRVPGLPVFVRQSRYRLDEGRYRTGGSELIVSRGLGTVGLPLRLACPPEAMLIRLKP